MSVIPRTPARPPAYDPEDPRYFDARDLEQEIRRTFQICHECRMCVNYCGAFPVLFDRVDRDIESGKAEGAELIDDADIKAVSDQCWQCKLCFIKCPYTKDDDAYELLDFPRLMGRERINRSKREGISFTDRILGEPQLIGKMSAGPMAGMANLINENQLLRKVQEKVTGISAEFPLPKMARESFPEWFDKHEPPATAGEAGEVVLFATCYGDYNAPEVPKAAVRVLEHNGFRVLLPGDFEGAPQDAAPTCCGMPNLDGGDLDAFRAKVRHNVSLLLPLVERGLQVVALMPTCGFTLKQEWHEYCPGDDVKKVSAATKDMMEFLVELARAKKLNRDFKQGLGKVAVHAPCHLRAQKIGNPTARLMTIVPDTEAEIIEECSAVDGTWGMKAEHYETGRKYAMKLVRAIDEQEPKVVLTDCNLSGLRIGKETKLQPMHPIVAMARVYGLADDSVSK